MPFLCMVCGNSSVCGAVVGYHTHDAGMCEVSWCCWGFFREDLHLKRRHLELSSPRRRK